MKGRFYAVGLAAAVAVSFALRLCALATANDNSITIPDPAHDVGRYTSLALDSAGNPVVSYQERSYYLKLLHCNDPNCAGGDESVTAPDANGPVGYDTSLELDAQGNPVVSYYHHYAYYPAPDVLEYNDELKVLHCNDPNCAGGDESIATPDASHAGQYNSLALDSAGNPVVSYFDSWNGDLKVLHCDDPNCGGNESSTTPDSAGRVGAHTSLVLDSVGNPVIAYLGITNEDLKVMHCNDPNCAGGNESIMSPDTGGQVGEFASLVLDAAGYPVVSYFDRANENLKLLHCNDANCAGGDDIGITVDGKGTTGVGSSLQLDAADNPVVAYYNATDQDLLVVRCNDPTCTGGDETIASPDAAGDVGGWNSLALDFAGRPVVSYFEYIERPFVDGRLKILHCNDINCIGGKVPTPRPTHPATATPTPTQVGARNGDVNCDEVANSIDAALMLQLVAGLVPSLPCRTAGDVNNDGLLSSIDVALVLQYVAGLVPSLPV